MKTILVSLIVIMATIAAVAYGFITISGLEPICWQKYPDKPCQTTAEIIKEKAYEVFENK